MQSSPDFSGSLRRHQDSPNFWLAVLAGSLAVHLLFLLSGRWFLVRVAPVKPRTTTTPIELVDLSPKSSGKPSQGVSLTAPKVASAPLENSSGATSSIQPSNQPSEPTQPTIVPSPSPKPLQERQPLADNSKRLSTQPSPVPQRTDTPKPIPPESATPPPKPLDGETNPSTPPKAPLPETQPDPEQPSGDLTDPPKPQTDPEQPSGNPISPPKSPQGSPNGTQPEPGLPPPGLPGTSQPGQSLPSTEVTIAAQVTASQIQRADPTRNESLAKTAQLRGSAQQQITIPYSPDYKLSPGQVLDLDVLFVVDTTTGKVIDSSVPNNSTPLSDAGLDKLVDRVFEPLLFDVTFDTAAATKAASTAWVVPVQIQVIK